MKVCPQCNAKYDYEMSFCLQDGTPLQTSDTLPLPPTPEEVPDDKTMVLPAAAAAPVSQQTVLRTPQPEKQPTNPQLVNPTAQDRANWQPAHFQSAPRKSYLGLLFAFPIMALVLAGISAGVGWLYWRDREKSNLAAVDSNKNSAEFQAADNSNFSPANNSSINLSNVNSSGNLSNNSSNAVATSNLTALSNNNAKPATPATNANILKTPTPENRSTPRMETPTPPKPTPEPETSEPVKPTPVPTPIPRPNVPKVVSMGVLNGKATSLVTPPYPPAAKAVRASGAVVVQVMIDENGNVVAARAVSGHPLLRQSAESAARASRFSPTVLSGQPVKVTGVVTYNFVPN